jgi:hypothetical protein
MEIEISCLTHSRPLKRAKPAMPNGALNGRRIVSGIGR